MHRLYNPDDLDLHNLSCCTGECWTQAVFSICAFWAYAYTGRRKVRQRLRIDGTTLEDFWTSCVCLSCSLAQEESELKRRAHLLYAFSQNHWEPGEQPHHRENLMLYERQDRSERYSDLQHPDAASLRILTDSEQMMDEEDGLSLTNGSSEDYAFPAQPGYITKGRLYEARQIFAMLATVALAIFGNYMVVRFSHRFGRRGQYYFRTGIYGSWIIVLLFLGWLTRGKRGIGCEEVLGRAVTSLILIGIYKLISLIWSSIF